MMNLPIALACLVASSLATGVVCAATPSTAMAVRPQTPRAPYPYAERELVFAGSTQGVKLAGTLTFPRNAQRAPAVILVSGTGPDDRDVTTPDGHKFFLLWADVLTRRGVAVLRLDDRSVGGSVGPRPTAAEIAIDIGDAVRVLRTQPEIDPNRIGLLGQSEGANVVAMVARSDPRVAFLVLLAAPAFRGADLTLQQVDAELALSTAPAEVKERVRRMQSKLVAAVTEPDTDEAALRTLSAAWTEYLAADRLPAIPLPDALAASARPPERWYLRYDPLPTLRALTQPVLVVLGDKDLRVPLVQNEGPLREALRANPRARVEVMAGINHFMQPAQTGTVAEASNIETTVAPQVLDLVGEWMTQQAAAALPSAERRVQDRTMPPWGEAGR